MGTYHYAVGKRKTSLAKVRLYPNGSGKIDINGKSALEYFKVNTQMGTILEPLKILEMDRQVDIVVETMGGGTTGQAHAIRHGISKALLLLDEKFRPPLKRKGFLTRDARTVERKKPGKKKARRSPQWAKR